MTHKETIKKLDELIAYLNSCRGQRINRLGVESKIHSTLNGLPISASTLSAIMNIHTIVEYPRDVLHITNLEGLRREHDKKAIVAMIDILNREKDAQVQAMQEETQKIAIEEQKKGNQIQKNALYVSVFAIIISLVSLIVAICK